MKKLIWQVTENNGGGLTLYVWESETLIYAHAGYEYADPSQLRDDLVALTNGEHPIDNCWEGNDLLDEEIVRGIRGEQGNIVDSDSAIIPLTHDEYYDNHPSTQVICDEDGPVDMHDMGKSGQRIFTEGRDGGGK